MLANYWLRFQQTVTADRIGRYHFDGMPPGSYLVQVSVPDGLTVASTSSATVNATLDEAVTLDFTVTADRKTYLPLLNR